MFMTDSIAEELEARVANTQQDLDVIIHHKERKFGK